MKRVVVLITVALLGSMGLAQAQKVNEVALSKKIEKLEADSKDAKKNGKASLWLNMGKAYYDAGAAITSQVYRGMDEVYTMLTFGAASVDTVKTVEGKEYKVSSFPYVDLYFDNGLLAFWDITKPVFEGDLDKSAEAYQKAAELDKSRGTITKASEGLQAVVNTYKQIADNEYAQRQFKTAAAYFAKAYDLASGSVLNKIDTLAGYNAGLLATVVMDYPMGEKYLNEAASHDYTMDGDVYYYLSICYNGENKTEEAKKVLQDALAKYPKNTKIIEGLLNVYANTGEDPTAIIPLVETAIAEDPTNAELYAGLGRVNEKLGKLPEAIAAFQKAVELLPDDFSTNFNLGLTVIKYADELAKILNEQRFTSQEAYNAELAKVYAAYEKSIVPLEKAHSIDPKDVASVELLKNVFFRLRDEAPSMMDNYNKYNELFQSMQE